MSGGFGWDRGSVKVNEMIKQGSVLGAVLSAITIDSLTRIMNNFEKKWNIEGTEIDPLLFQDDIFAVNRTEDIQETVNVIETFQNLKRLHFHEEKTKKSILSGKKDEKVTINGVEVDRVQSHKYLGKMIEENKGKEEIKQRITKAIGKTNECMSIINKNRFRKKRIDIGLKLLQTEVIPVLTFGAETWPKLTEKEKNDINNVQTHFLARLLKVPKSTPKCALIGETNLMKIEHIANQRKLEYYLEINNREEWRLEVKMRKIQEERNLSYIREVKELLEYYNIELNLEEGHINAGRKAIKVAIRKTNDKEIKEEIAKSKKYQNIRQIDPLYMKRLNFEDARVIFMIAARMIKVKNNFKNMHKDLKCDKCDEKVEDTLHLLECKEYENLNKAIKTMPSVTETLKCNTTEKVATVVKHILSIREGHPIPSAQKTGLIPLDRGRGHRK